MSEYANKNPPQLVAHLRASRSTWQDARGVPSDLEAAAADMIELLDAKLAEVELDLDQMRLSRNHWATQFETAETALTAARAALVTAQTEALEEAAKVADRSEEHRAQQLSEEAGVRDYTQRQRWQAGKIQAELIAKNIRALATQTQEKADE